MKRFKKSILGVTLLEIMLVLAIAAMIIVMSVRYYQSANINQQANAFLAQLQAMQAAADSLSQATGSYSAATASSIVSIVGGTGNTVNTPWGGTITPSKSSASTMLYTMGGAAVSTAVCTLVKSRLAANTHWSSSSGSAGAVSGCVTIYYNSNT